MQELFINNKGENKLKKINKVVLIFSLIILLLIEKSYGKYNFNYTLNAFSLSRDNSEITYNIEKNVLDGEYVNRDVELIISFNKEIDEIEGFEYFGNKQTIKKVLENNESNTITAVDISGNKKEVQYSINNIDKIPPEIIGVEDGGTYNTDININYEDNIGIKDIYVDKYSSLSWPYYPDYYETNFYKGIDVTNSTVTVKLSGHPKGTKKYRYYLNNVLKKETDSTKYIFTGLNPGTNYKIKVEAIDINGIVLSAVERNVKTKFCKTITGTRNDTNKTFNIKITGIDSKIKSATCVGFVDSNTHKSQNVSIKSDRSLSYTFSALNITSTLQNGYYYFHVQLWDANKKLVETICCNIIFNTNYIEGTSTNIDPYILTKNGNYQIIVTDLAGNKTEKNIVIKK